ncbi:MAG: hypothetical protein E4H14_12910 [Candidatus Thorarchaeota archaeon]|nr:MAG: hypothetical protein E4H14_12910 [Candidatus Thorarchaeota archaeon]
MKRVKPILLIAIFLTSMLIVPSSFVIGSLNGDTSMMSFDGSPESQALISQLSHNARVAIYDEDNLTVPVISDAQNLSNNLTEITTLLEGAGHSVDLLTEEDILAHDLITADYDVFIIVDNIPRPSIFNLIKEFSLGGGGLMTFDSAVSYLWFGGYINEALTVDEGNYNHWGYFESVGQNVTARHPTMTDYHPGDNVTIREDYWATIWGPELTAQRGDDMIILMNNSITPNHITAFAIDNSRDGGRIVHLPGDGYNIASDMESIILDSVNWLVPKPKGRILFDYTHQPRIGIDSWDTDFLTTYIPPNIFEQFRNLAVNHSYTFDKLYPLSTGNITAARLAPYDVLIMAWPDLNYTVAEGAVIDAWVNGGGSLLVLGDRTGLGFPNNYGDETLNMVLQNFDMSLGTTNELNFAVMTPGTHITLEGCTGLSMGYRNFLSVLGNATTIWFDGTDPVVAGQEYGAGRAILSADMNIFDNGALGLTSNRYFALNVLNWLSSSDASILVHTDYLGWNDAVCRALRDLGLSYSLFNTRQYLDEFLDSQSWDLLIYNNVNHWPESIIYDKLYAFVNTGGTLILTTFTVDNHPTHPLWSKMGVEYQSTLSGSPSMYFWDASHPVFTEPNNHTMYNYTSNGPFGDDGDAVVYFEGYTALAGTTATPQNGTATIVVSDDRKTLFNSIIIDNFGTDEDDSTYADSVELWQNEIAYLLTEPSTTTGGLPFGLDTMTLLIIAGAAVGLILVIGLLARRRGGGSKPKPKKSTKKK